MDIGWLVAVPQSQVKHLAATLLLLDEDIVRQLSLCINGRQEAVCVLTCFEASRKGEVLMIATFRY